MEQLLEEDNYDNDLSTEKVKSVAKKLKTMFGSSVYV